MDESNNKQRGDVYTSPPLRQQTPPNQQMQLPTYRLEFSKFSGDNPICWLRKSNKYFSIHQIEDFYEVSHASYYFSALVDLWGVY